MLRFRETKVAKENFYGAKTKTNSKYLIGYLGNVIRPLVLVLPKISGYVKTFKIKQRDRVKNNKLMHLHIDD